MDTAARRYDWQDHVIINSLKCLRSLLGQTPSTARHPTVNVPDTALTQAEQRYSASLMRINHCGEICAQALYLGQSFTARELKLRTAFSAAAHEETEHLHWCAKRLNELQSHSSYLNPLWFTGSLLIGTCAGLAGDRWSLGFLAQTEQQVSAHLGKHLHELPAADLKSRAIVAAMQEDEIKHASNAIHLGAAELPSPIKFMMRSMAKIMTSIAYYV